MGLIHRPEVLFLDEPTTGLNPLVRASVWAEIRRLNVEFGMTIFLTTQYLDEADALANRVGIIDQGRVVAEGSPEELKRSIGRDLIVAEVDGEDPTVVARLRVLNGIDSVSCEPGRIIVAVTNGPAELSPVAIALNNTSLRVRALTLRTPTLDDVFIGTHWIAHSGSRPRMTVVEVDSVLGRQAGFGRDVTSVAGRALRQMRREPTSVIPAVFVPAFFYVVNLGAPENVASHASGLDYKAFLIPMAIAFAVTGMTHTPALVTDIQDGYFDRLCLTPIRRSALLLGLMAADVAVLVLLCIPVLVMGFALGVRFETGLGGVALFVVICGLWGLVFTGFPYAVALKTGNPAAVNACFVVFFPLFFLTDAVAPKAALTGWFSTIATYNPVTYLLGALRSLITTGWDATALLEGVAAVIGIGCLSMSLAFLALRGRVRTGE